MTKHKLLQVAIIASALAVAIGDIAFSSDLMVARLFTLPLALCAFQTSMRLLAVTTAGATLSTVVAGFLVHSRATGEVTWADAVNRGMLIASLLVFAVFIYLVMRNVRLRLADADRIRAMSEDLAARNRELVGQVSDAATAATVREEIAARVAQSERQYRGLLEAAPDAIIVSDTEGKILLVNAETERLFGYERAELIGQPVDILVPQGARGRHSGHRASYAAHPRTRAMGEGRKLSGLRKDGSELPVEISLSPTELPEGLLITTAIRDISARIESEKTLRLTEERHRMAVEVAEMGTWTMNLASGELTWSDEFARLYGFAPADSPAREDIVSRIPADERARVGEAVKAAVEGRSAYDVEYRIMWPDGSIRWIASRGRLHRNAEGTPVDIQGVIMDVTERRQIEDLKLQREAEQRRAEALQRSNEELQQFAYIAAHDLQEPLRMVASYTQLLAQRYKGRLDSDADDFIAFAVDGARRMQMLISDLLAYCRVETAGKEMLDVPSREAFAEALRNLEGAIAESDAQITCDPLPEVMADRTQLVQLFQNLIGNAIKYRTSERPQIHVSARRGRPNEWIFSIRDNGIGIDPKYSERIFLMFQRLHSRDEFSGTGIGLTLCKKIAERHGGRIWVEPNTGPGSTFHVALPERVKQ
jgi:PAS domain S-box-containing protein